MMKKKRIFYRIIGFFSVLILGLLLGKYLAPVYLKLFIAVNALSFVFYSCDKFYACHHKQRISEKTLLNLSIPYASFGALMAMLLFNHKIKKGRFMFWFWCVILLQIILPLFWMWYKKQTM